MKLSVIIVNYNVRAFLENALISIGKAMEGIDGEIIVADNASDDGSVEMMRGKFPNVTLIANEQNVGFAAANNQAFLHSRGEYFLLINPDTIVQEDTFRVMIDFLDTHPEVGLAGCRILNPDGTLQLACRRSFPTPWVALTKIMGLSTLFSHSRIFGRYNLAYLDPDKTYEVDAVSGSFMFVRRKAIEHVGILDDQFFMYGEDLDWCYRIKKAGWKIYYVHSTQIVHYKGQSVRRSDIDDVKLFYHAMRLFVKKHFSYGVLFELVLGIGIALREWIAFLAKISKSLRAATLDFVLVNIALFFGELLWFGELFHFPAYAYPVTMTLPALIIVATMYTLGVYTKRKHSVWRAVSSVAIGYIIISALTFFFKQYGFSRMVVIISGAINLVALPSWRLAARAIVRSPVNSRRSLFGRRTLIVGIENNGQEVLRKLRARIDHGYDVVGFIDVDRRRIGERVFGVEILGSIDNIGKMINEQKVSEVIFSTDSLSYADILSVIGRSRSRTVNFRLVPTSLEVIIGKTHIDELDDIPLVDIDYNIDRPMNRFSKRLFDLVVSGLLLVSTYPIILLKQKLGARQSEFEKKILLVPKVVRSEMSLVGPPEFSLGFSRNGSAPSHAYLGKVGLTGLVQVNYRDDLTPEEVEKYNLYYAKNQSLILDLEILTKSFLLLMRN